MPFRTALLIALLVATAMPAAVQAGALPDTETLRAWVDLRLSHTDGEAGWRDGGFGKLRYGQGTRADIAQAAVLWTPRLADTLTANVMVQSFPGAETPSVVEAYVRWKPVPTTDLRFSLRAGQMFPPVSLEHDGPGWTATRTLTPSMINSWIGEEVLVDGFEATVQKPLGAHRFGVTAGVFMGADTAGTALTFRGWAQHDRISGNGAVLPLPASSPSSGWAAVFTRQAALSRPLVEVDGRAGGYLRLDWRPPAPFDVNLVIYDNPGKPTEVRHGQYAWTTRFTNLGVRWQATARDEVLVQGLHGLTKMGAVFADGTHPADIAYESAYALVTHSLTAGERLSGRFDYFATKDHSLQSLDDNSEKGFSLTAAFTRAMTDHLDLTVEAVQIASRHTSRLTHGLEPQQSQTQVQIAVKLHL